MNMLHNIINGKAPDYMCTFDFASDLHDHNTRNSFLSFMIPNLNTQGQKTFMYQAAKSWNCLPSELKAIKSKNVFKYKCKLHHFKLMDVKENCPNAM